MMTSPSRSSRTVAITYAWGHDSTGDMAILPGLCRLLRQALPHVQPVIFTMSSDPGYTATAGYLQQLEPGFQVFPDPFAPLMGKGSPEELWWRYLTLLLKPEAAIQEARSRGPGMDAWLQADLRLFNSSMQLTYHHQSGAQRLRFWLPNALAQRLGLPYALWSQSFGDIEWPGREMLKFFLSDADLVTSRDADSLQVLADVGLSGPFTAYTADPVLFFDYFDDAWAGNLLRELGLQPKRYLVVLPRTYEFWGQQPPDDVLAERMTKIACAIDAWVKQTGYPVLLGYEIPREKERTRQWLWPRLGDASRAHCHLFAGEWRAEQALSVFRQAGAVLSMERYSVYMALTAGVPVLHPTSNAVSLRMDVLNRIGLGHCHLLIDTCSGPQLAEELLRVHADSAHHLAQAKTGVAQLKTESVAAMRRLEERFA